MRRRIIALIVCSITMISLFTIMMSEPIEVVSVEPVDIFELGRRHYEIFNQPQESKYYYHDPNIGEITVTIYWIEKDLGQIKFEYLDGTSSDTSVFESDGERNHFILNNKEYKFSINEENEIVFDE